MKCKEKGCTGVVNKEELVPFRFGLSIEISHPCGICGRLYWENGKPVVYDRSGDKAFWINKQVIHKPDRKKKT
jgi:hypothetical protein